MNREVFENCAIKVTSTKKFSITKRKPSHATTESTLFAVSKDEWNTKEGTGTL